MKKRTHSAACPRQYLTAFGLNPDRVIYFDIETTGFRASTSGLYMIGWAVSAGEAETCAPDTGAADSGKEEHGKKEPEREWVICQIMAESRAEEILLLEQFADVLKNYDTIVEFNGDRFDLPYMREKYAMYGMADPFCGLNTVDLYQEIRPFKRALGLTSLNQKSVEQFLEIHREDPYNGGELIDIYRSVRDGRCPDEKGALDALFLHNYEDVLGMLDMTPLLAYRLAAENTAPVRARKTSPSVIEVSCLLEVPVPRPLNCSPGEHCSIALSGDLAKIIIRPYAGCMYHFFPDWKNYYYLPAEDTAMHKSVASFVDPSHREKAKAQTCYVKKEGIFLPVAGSFSQRSSGSLSENAGSPVFQRRYKDPLLWFEYRPGMEQENGAFSEYVHSLIRDILSIR